MTDPSARPSGDPRPSRRGMAAKVALATTLVVGAAGCAAPAEDPYAWETVTVGGGGWVTGLAVGGAGDVYARTDVGGAYRWDEPGQRWEQIVTAAGVPEPTTEDYLVEALAVAPSDGAVVYMAVGGSLDRAEGRILRSGDGGRTWRDGGRRFTVHGNAEWRQGGARLAVDPSDPDIVLFGSRTEGLWRSEDGGGRWRRLDSLPAAVRQGATPAGVTFAVFDAGPTTGPGPTSTAWVGVEGVGVVRTSDAGTSWEVVHEAPGGVPRDAELAADGRLYAVVGGARSELVRIEPGADAGTRIEPEAGIGAVAVDPLNPDLVIAGAEGVRDGHLWRSRDGGDTWDALDVEIESGDAWPERTDLEGYMSVGDLAFDPARPGALWFAEGMGVWRTTDVDGSTVTWDFDADGIETLVSNDAARPAGSPLLTAHWDRGVFRHPGGDAARPVVTGRFNSAWSLDVAAHDPSFVVAVVDDHRDCCAGDGLSGQSGFSTDGGATWRRFASLEGSDHPEDLRFGNIAVSSGDVDDLVWVPSDGGAVHHSRDRGASWLASDYPGSEPHHARALHRQVLTSDPGRPGTFYVLDVDGVMRSTDGGATWEEAGGRGLPAPAGLRYNATLAAVPGRPGQLLLTTGLLDEGESRLHHSDDGGDTWTQRGGLSEVGRFGFGAPLERGGPPAVYATGRDGDDAGLWRSGDLGETWRLLSRAPAGRHQDVTALTGDPEVAGRVYVGFSGTGFVVGSPEAEAGAPPDPPTRPGGEPGPSPGANADG